jgi:thioredoxin 1
MRTASLLLLIIVAITTISSAQTPSAALNQWKDVLLTGDAGSLRFLYSTDPAPRLLVPSGQTTLKDDVAFWTGLKITAAYFKSLQNREIKPGIEQDIFTVQLKTESGKDLYVSVQQLWQKQPQGWRLVVAQRTDAASLEGASEKDLYPAEADARAEIREALAQAVKKHHRVLVVFGANWCYDCHVLDLAFHSADVAPIVAKNYEVVHVDIGEGDKNQDVMKDYQIPMQKGIPAIAVLDLSGKLLFSQKKGEFEKARSLDRETLLAFLNQWKPS